MENPCYKCGQAVEEGVAFCPHCGAPQIRVVVSEPPPAVAANSTSSLQNLPAPSAAQDTSYGSPSIRWSRAARPCALAALVGSLLTSLGLNPFVAMVGVGFLAVVLYRQRRPGIQANAVSGAGLGAFGGVLWFVISSIAGGLVVFAMHKEPELHEEVLKRIQQAASGNNDPQVQALLEYVKTSGGFAVVVILSLILVFFAAMILGSIGGAIGGALFGRRDRS
jgi:hypothetical protein